MDRQGLQKVDVRQYYDKAFISSIWRSAEAGYRVLGLLIVIVIVLLLSQERLTVGMALVRSGIR